MHDCLIVGAGVIGLSIARQLASRQRSVLIVDRQRVGSAASWAASGILPPPAVNATHDPVEQLRAVSHAHYPHLAQELVSESGVDIELRRCGGLYVARQAAEAVALRATIGQLRQDGVTVQVLDPARLGALEPALDHLAPQTVQAACFLPDEYRVRAPRYLQALEASCSARGVQVRTGVTAPQLVLHGGRVAGVRTSCGLLQARHYCLAAGAWTASLLEQVDWHLPIRPWRGQIVLWKTARPLITRVVNEGMRYLVPRDDGHLLAGSTVEDAGFNCQTTAAAIDDLRAFARDFLPALRHHAVVKSWAGLRPGTPDGRPFLGRVPAIENLSVATGHFRSGIHLAPATALLMAQLIVGETPGIDLSPFRLNR